MQRIKIIRIIGVIAVLAMVAAACSSGDDESGGTTTGTTGGGATGGHREHGCACRSSVRAPTPTRHWSRRRWAPWSRRM